MTNQIDLRQHHERLVSDLAFALDTEAGLAEALQHLQHDDIVDHITQTLDVETGLAAALDQDDELPLSTTPQQLAAADSPLLESSQFTKPAAEPLSPEHLSDTAFITELMQPIRGVLDELHQTSELQAVRHSLDWLATRLQMRNISRVDADRQVEGITRAIKGLRARRPGHEFARLTLLIARLVDLRRQVYRLFDTSDDFSHSSAD